MKIFNGDLEDWLDSQNKKELNYSFPYYDNQGDMWINNKHYLSPRVEAACYVRDATEEEIKQYKLFKKLERL